jgi:hypothetical protein
LPSAIRPRTNAALAKANQEAAIGRAAALREVFAELEGLSTHKAAAELERRGVPTPTGKPWNAIAVLRVRKRLAAMLTGFAVGEGL